MNKVTKYIIKYWFAYVLGILFTVASVALDMLSPQVTKRIIDNVIIGGDLDLLPTLLIIVFIIGFGRCIFQYFKEFAFDIVSSRISLNIRRDLFKHIQSLSLNFFDKNNTGELMSRVKDDVDRIWEGLGFVGMLIIEITIHTTLVLFCMYQLCPTLAVIPTILVPLMGALAIFMEKKLGKVYESISEENARLNTVAQENLAGVRTVKAFARETHEIKKFLSHNQKYYDLNMKQSKVFIKYYPYFQFVTKVLPLVVIILGGYQVIHDKMTLGTLGAFVEYSMNIVWPMEMLGWLSNMCASCIASTKRIGKIYAEEPMITENNQPIILNSIEGNICFDHVSFSIDNKSILSDISFDLSAGKTIGIMGATGTGKSSIINLLQRFYDVTEGNIYLDNIAIKDLALKQLRGCISLVMQDVFLFSDTITENVIMGKRSYVNQQEVEDASSKAQASEFIEKLEEQYETIVGERGVGLSGGQKQRISIARALAKKTPILVLDDSTSALDMETEHLIQSELTQTASSKIIIAHRISAVRNADEILILENGKIVERGTHETLLQAEGYYYKTYMAQYGDYLNDIDITASVFCQRGGAVCQ
jgi:ATP-binding cassette, subfamily B, multidrug efflux pump